MIGFFLMPFQSILDLKSLVPAGEWSRSEETTPAGAKEWQEGDKERFKETGGRVLLCEGPESK